MPVSLAGRNGRVSRLFAGTPREACDLRVRRCAPLPDPVCSGSSCDGVGEGEREGAGQEGREGQLRGLLLQAQHALRARAATSPARRSGPTTRTGCGRRSRCASSSARSAAARSPGRSLARRSRPRCTRSRRRPARRAGRSTPRPGVSVSPWARIEANTHSAARLKMRSSAGIASAEHEQREGHRRHALGPNQAMNAVAVARQAGPDQREPDRDRSRDEQREGDDRHRRPAVAEQPVERQQRAEDDEDPELDDLDDVVGPVLERARAGRGAGCRA